MKADQIEPLKREIVARYVEIDSTRPDNTASIATIQFLAHPFLSIVLGSEEFSNIDYLNLSVQR